MDPEDDDWEMEPTSPQLRYTKQAGANEGDEPETTYHLLDGIGGDDDPDTAPTAAEDTATAPGSEPRRVAPEHQTDKPASAMDEFINEHDLTVEVTDDPSGSVGPFSTKEYRYGRRVHLHRSPR